MEPRSSKLQHQQETVEQTTQQPPKTEFNSVEEMLRQDAAQIEPPAAIAIRLADSIAREPKPARSWWRKLFSRPSSP